LRLEVLVSLYAEVVYVDDGRESTSEVTCAREGALLAVGVLKDGAVVDDEEGEDEEEVEVELECKAEPDEDKRADDDDEADREDEEDERVTGVPPVLSAVRALSASGTYELAPLTPWRDA